MPGRARGPALALTEPLSFWGGVDARTGEVVDRHHPQRGAVVSRKVVVMPGGRGSSSSSTVLTEAARLRTAPVAIVLAQPDVIVALGALVAAELYGTELPVVAVEPGAYAAAAAARRIEVVADARTAAVTVDGRDGRDDHSANSARPSASGHGTPDA